MKSMNITIRSLHRDLGYFAIGLTLLYAITGVILSGRALGWMEESLYSKTVINKNITQEEFKIHFINSVKQGKVEKVFEKESYKKLEKHLELKLVKNKDNTFYFNAWKSLDIIYNYGNGELEVSYKGYPPYIKLFIQAHKATHESAWFYLGIIYSVILCFLAISALWMSKGKNGFKSRGIYFMLAGFFTIALFLFL